MVSGTYFMRPSEHTAHFSNVNNMLFLSQEIPKQTKETSTNPRKDSWISTGSSSSSSRSSDNDLEIPEPVGNHAFRTVKVMSES